MDSDFYWIYKRGLLKPSRCLIGKNNNTTDGRPNPTIISDYIRDQDCQKWKGGIFDQG